ncbi:NAD(P)/FAD-dependent oxidoreductase [Mycobacterium sp. Marseille-P9652]|uniref:NAD(P)/FAD-dependent oxidoreductase n=1 Tax=Mycobacterium sp. Marseille-P9652 TaxID=2654950 RepID=UPI001E4652F7|nr:NAD(P)/FAD-dependent oxidoreductase [Mycobacterium sp. Marseille-P9652]
MTVDVDVLVVGAGLAGLRCAGLLAAAGRDVRVWEAGDDVGGRIRTDAIDGFLCDRGFQVLNPAYPELPRAVDVAALRLQPFGAGVAVRRQRGAAVLVHPLREPARVPKMLASGAVRPREALALARWALPALRPRTLKEAGDDRALADGLDRCGVRGELRRMVDRFLAGVLLEDTGATSNAFGLLLARMFALGVPGLPADGMGALPRQLAAPLRDRIGLDRRVDEIARDGDGWRVRSAGATVRANTVVVATGPAAAAALTGRPAPPTHGVVTDWWAADEAPATLPLLWVDARERPPGPVLNTAVISAAAPTYAPPGRHLISASALVAPDGEAPPETAVRRHAADILGADGSRWEPVIRHVVSEALPAQPPPLRVRGSLRLDDGLWWCGDHRDTASIQGALVSGRRAAERILHP